MAYKDNWMNHLLAAFTGEGFNNKLAQDFWSEDLFNPKAKIKYHWFKLVWVYSASVIAQLTLTGTLLMIPITFYKNGGADWTYALIAVVGATLIFWILAIIFATATWLDILSKTESKWKENAS